jgi:membrane protease YdiL (CAAX protease family)
MPFFVKLADILSTGLTSSNMTKVSGIAVVPGSVDIALLVYVAIGMPFIAWLMHLKDKADKAKDIDTPLPKSYRTTFIFLWAPTITILAAWLYAARALDIIGLSFEGTLANWIGMGVTAVIAIFFYREVQRVRNSVSVAESALKQIEGQPGIEDILPTTKHEYRLFQLVSITAGITEEILFRGFLIWGFTHYVPLWVAAGLSLIMFTLAHLYQGSVAAIARVFAVGLVLTLMYILSGSLIPAILLHIVVDLASGGAIWHARQKVEDGK